MIYIVSLLINHSVTNKRTYKGVVKRWTNYPLEEKYALVMWKGIQQKEEEDTWKNMITLPNRVLATPGGAGRRRAGPPTTHDFRPAQKQKKRFPPGTIFFFFSAFFCQRHSPYGTRAQLFPWKNVRNLYIATLLVAQP